MTGTDLPARNEKVANGADRTVTILLICGQAFASFTIGGLSLLFAMISDGCFDEPDDPFICSDNGGLVFMGGILLEWLLLAAGVIVSIVLSVRAMNRGDRSWPKPFIGTAVGLLGIVVLIINITVAAG
ncbi:MAG: hypothetical protein ABW075_07145 [Aeromicrobium sp.]